ncbi:MAG: hypothetical protein HY538_04680, partial [Deltaproteobacteria bacterium]|nr:hypothetical protein [Deltaproteobacteria bacterium]
PLGDLDEKRLKKLSLKELDLVKGGVREIHNLAIDGIGNFPLTIEKAWQADFHTTFRKVFVRILQFKSPEETERFWLELSEASTKEISRSIQINLGDGAHWYFRHDDFAGVMWYRDRWFTFIDVEAASLGEKHRVWFEAENLRGRVIEEMESFYTTYDPEEIHLGN